MTDQTPPLSLSSIAITRLDDQTLYASAELAPITPRIFLQWRIPFIYHFLKQALLGSTWQYLPAVQDARTRARQIRQRQRLGVRALLHHLLGTLGIVDALDEQRFPYRLVKTGKYVCFSHSQTCVAVALSDMHPIGIDVETQAIDWRVAKRFYHADDVRQLQRLPIDKRAMVSLWLWQIKESFIKIHQYTLAQGLGVHYANLVAALIAISDEPTTPVSITLDSHTVHLAHTPSITVVYKIAH